MADEARWIRICSRSPGRDGRLPGDSRSPCDCEGERSRPDREGGPHGQVGEAAPRPARPLGLRGLRGRPLDDAPRNRSALRECRGEARSAAGEARRGGARGGGARAARGGAAEAPAAGLLLRHGLSQARFGARHGAQPEGTHGPLPEARARGVRRRRSPAQGLPRGDRRHPHGPGRARAALRRRRRPGPRHPPQEPIIDPGRGHAEFRKCAPDGRGEAPPEDDARPPRRLGEHAPGRARRPLPRERRLRSGGGFLRRHPARGLRARGRHHGAGRPDLIRGNDPLRLPRTDAADVHVADGRPDLGAPRRARLDRDAVLPAGLHRRHPPRR